MALAVDLAVFLYLIFGTAMVFAESGRIARPSLTRRSNPSDIAPLPTKSPGALASASRLMQKGEDKLVPITNVDLSETVRINGERRVMFALLPR